MSTDKGEAFVGRWVWLLPGTLVVHILEEGLVGEGFYGWLAHVDVHMSALRWWLMNLGFLLAMTLLVFCVRRRIAPVWMLVACGVEIFLNGLGHLVGTLSTGFFSPGIVSGLVIWVPLGLVTLRRAQRHVRASVFVFGLVAGLALRASVIGTALVVSWV